MLSLGEIINDLWDLSLGYLLNPNKRIYWLYLLMSLLLAYYVYRRSKRRTSFFAYIFNRRVWLSRSARVDYLFFFCNACLKLFLIIPYISFGFKLSFYICDGLTAQYGYITSPLAPELAIILYTFVLSLLMDFAVYLTHLAMHRLPFLWEFHKVHHSARSMNPITQYRLHPIELIINNLVSILVFGFVTGVFNYFVDGQIDKWLFLGANIFSFIFFMFGANLRHSHVALRYFNVLEYIFISPRQHQIHHSQAREHWNKNMGSRLALWDWLFGTLYLSKDTRSLSFGLGAGQDPKYQTFSANLIKPFTNNFHRLLGLISSKK